MKRKISFIMGFIFLISIVSIVPAQKVLAYGEVISGFQTHYEVQNQYISGRNLIIEGFYFALDLQNYTSSDRTSGTHYYYIELTNESNGTIRTYYDSGGYYMDLTTLESTAGYSWASASESALVSPHLSSNYRYKDVGFQFIIPLSDLSEFIGTDTNWKVNIILVGTNNIYGTANFRQSNLYASTSFGNVTGEGYTIKEVGSISSNQSVVSAVNGYVNSSPAGGNHILYSGSYIYWRQGYTLYNMSFTSFNTADKVTWYRFPYGNYYWNGTWQVSYLSSSSKYGWIPSTFLGSIGGNPYKINIENIPPVITAEDIVVDEGTYLDYAKLTANAFAYDYSFGTIKPAIDSTNLTINTDLNRAGVYNLTFKVLDSNFVTATKTISVTINNIPPVITAEPQEIKYGKILTEELLFRNVKAEDVFDGNLTDQVQVIDYDGLILDSNVNPYGTYDITYSVTDSNGATTTFTVPFTITYKYVRAISLQSIDTLKFNSKWQAPELKTSLMTILNRYGDESRYDQIWVFDNTDRSEIQAYMTTHAPGEETNQWFLDNYSDCKIQDNLK